MNTFRTMLVLSSLAMLPALQAADDILPASSDPVIQVDQDKLINIAWELRDHIMRKGTVVRSGLKLSCQVKDNTELQAQVDQFNTTMNKLLDGYQKHYKLKDRKALEQALLRSPFGKIFKSGTYDNNALPDSRRVMAIDGVETFAAANGPNNAQKPARTFGIYYTKDADLPAGDEERVQIYRTAMLNEPMGWVPKKYLREWSHNIVLQMRNPQNRRITIEGSGSPAYIPSVLFYGEAGKAGAIGPFMTFSGKTEKQQETLDMHNYQMGIAAVAQNGSFSKPKAESFQQSYGVQFALPANSYNDTLVLPILATGEHEYTDATGQDSYPYKVRMVSYGKKKQDAPSPAAAPIAQTEIYIVMDLTVSMKNFITGLKEALSAQIQSIPDEYKPHIRLGIIGFRDKPKQGGRIYKAFRFHGRQDGKNVDTTAYYDYTSPYKSLLPVSEFLPILDQVRDPAAELAAQGIKGAQATRQMNDLKDEDAPECLYEALDEALISRKWSTEDGVKRFVVVVGDAPDKSLNKGIAQAQRIRTTAEEKKIFIAPLYLNNVDNKKNIGIGQQQFSALASKESATVQLDAAGNITGGLDYSTGFKAIIGTIISLATDGKASSGLSEEEQNNETVRSMVSMADSLFGSACFAASDNKILRTSLNNEQSQQEADTTGSQEYWVTEYDPLAVAAGASEDQARVFDRYALMTKPQLKQWIEVAYAIHERMMQSDGSDEEVLFRDLAGLLLAGTYSEEAVQRAYADPKKWDTLFKWADEKLPFPSPFLKYFFGIMNGDTSKDQFDFESEVTAFGRSILALRQKLDSGEIMQSGSEVKLNDTEGGVLHEDEKMYKVPLKLLP